MTGRVLRLAPLALGLALLAPGGAAAQESVFNLGTFGLPSSGEAMRARALGGAGLGLGRETFGLENPAQIAGFRRAGLYLSILGTRTEVEDPFDSGDIEDVYFPVGQVVIPAWGGLVLGLGYRQHLDFDARLESTVEVVGDTVPVPIVLDADGTVAALSPTLAYAFDERTTAGVSVDLYLGSREVIRTVEAGDVDVGAIRVGDSLTRDFRGVGATFGVERAIGERFTVSAAYRLVPTLDSEITEASSAEALEGIDAEFDLPNELVLGATARFSERLLATVAWRSASWSEFAGPGIEPDRVADAFELGGGIEWSPRSRTALLLGPGTPLRLGIRYRELPLEIDGETVTEWAAAVGYGLGFGDRSRIDAVLEAGRRGSLDDHGLSETFVRLGVGVAVFEEWQRID